MGALKSANKVMALVPMKGHSERVPNKNLRLFRGRPLYHHIVTSLLACPPVEVVFINTDSETIACDVRRSFPERVQLIARPTQICGDTVSMNTIIHYDLSQIDGQHFLQTHSTNPLIKTSTIVAAIEKYFSKGDHDSLFGVNRFQSRFYDHTGKPINHNMEEMLRTQDLPPIYEENSNLYLFSRESFHQTGRRIGNKPVFYEIPRTEAMDIDIEEDFKLAELIYGCVTETKD